MKIKKLDIFSEEQLNRLQNGSLKGLSLSCPYSDLARIMYSSYNDATSMGEYWIEGLPNINRPKDYVRKFVTVNGGIENASAKNMTKGVRIVANLGDIEDFDISKVDEMNFEYPLTVIGGSVERLIDKLFVDESKLLKTTGRKHNVDDVLYDEYEVFGVRFVAIKSKTDNRVLTDGTYSKKDKDTYLKIEKIPFTIDEEEGIMYSDIVLYTQKLNQNSKNTLKDSNIYRFLNDGFLPSINDELERTEPKQAFSASKYLDNRYNFDYTELSEEDIIEICIKSNISVFLHGKTGVGKTERMLALDKSLELVDFGCTSSDGFTGIVAKDFNSKDLFLYEPYWYKSLCKKCEEEPDLIHILFLDELTNAKSDVQKVAFEVTLNKVLTNSGFRLRLPENAVVCAAGNEESESRSSNGLSEPLFGRFAHVYIETDSENWLKWALRRQKEEKRLEYVERVGSDVIHPAIVAYIKMNGDKVLRTKYNGVTPNADPRKWALASKALTKCNNPNVLRAFVGKEITKDFIEFCKLNLITVEDVLLDRCTPDMLPTDPSVIWNTVVCLAMVDDENVEKVRNFVAQFGKEFLSVFDYEWSKDSDERLIKLYQNQQTEAVSKLVRNGNK